MIGRKTIVFVGDGMADEPIASLGGKTPLQYARTPAMDSIARAGRSGTLLTLPAGFPTSSEVANMSVLGCDLATEYCGRGPLEAAGRGVPLRTGDRAFRLNLVNVQDGVLRDFSAGHIAQDDAREIVAALSRQFGNEHVRFHAGVSYRNILVLSGDGFSEKVACEKPDDNHGELVERHLPVARTAQAQRTEQFLRQLIREAPAFLESLPVNQRRRAAGHAAANGVWPWSGGTAGAFRTLREKYGVSGAVISAVDVINGLGRCLGMDVIAVPGATGYLDSNFEGKAAAAVAALKDHDFVYLHVEAIDEVSHEQNLAKKLEALEIFDSRVVAPVLAGAGPDVNVAVLPDHPVPIAIGKHTRTPVPVAVRMAGVAPDGIATFDEIASPAGSLGAMKGPDLMNLLLRRD